MRFEQGPDAISSQDDLPTWGHGEAARGGEAGTPGTGAPSRGRVEALPAPAPRSARLSGSGVTASERLFQAPLDWSEHRSFTDPRRSLNAKGQRQTDHLLRRP